MIRIKIASLALVALLVAPVAFADDTSDASSRSPSVVEKVESAVERGAKATARGIEHAARATANGVERGFRAAAGGVERGAKATANAVDHVAGKVAGSQAVEPEN
jgi:hypothetical protein